MEPASSCRRKALRIIPIEEEIQQTHFEELSDKAIINVVYTANLFQARLGQLLKPFGLTLQQFNILRILRGQHGNPIALYEVKHRMIDRNPDVSRIVDRMVRKGLIERAICPSDKRQADLRLLPKGETVLAATDPVIESYSERQRAISAADLIKLSSLLDRLRCGEQMDEAPTARARRAKSPKANESN
jgi:DNA-binding MarR family transcriptional regulator